MRCFAPGGALPRPHVAQVRGGRYITRLAPTAAAGALRCEVQRCALRFRGVGLLCPEQDAPLSGVQAGCRGTGGSVTAVAVFLAPRDGPYRSSWKYGIM